MNLAFFSFSSLASLAARKRRLYREIQEISISLCPSIETCSALRSLLENLGLWRNTVNSDKYKLGGLGGFDNMSQVGFNLYHHLFFGGGGWLQKSHVQYISVAMAACRSKDRTHSMRGMADIVDDGVCVDIEIIACVYRAVRLAYHSRELLLEPAEQAGGGALSDSIQLSGGSSQRVRRDTHGERIRWRGTAGPQATLMSSLAASRVLVEAEQQRG